MSDPGVMVTEEMSMIRSLLEIKTSHVPVATAGNWNGLGNTLAYQWQRSTNNGNTWSSIAGATSSSYSLGVGDEGAILRILVTVSNPDATVSAPSNPTATVATSPPSNNSLPTIRGVAQRGNSLSSTTGAWAGTGNTFTLQWQRSADNGTTWTNISGATPATVFAGRLGALLQETTGRRPQELVDEVGQPLDLPAGDRRQSERQVAVPVRSARHDRLFQVSHS